MQQAKTQLFATEAALPALNIARLQAANALAVLLGMLPETLEPKLALKEPRDIPGYDERLAQASTKTEADDTFIAEYDLRSMIPVAPTPAANINPDLVRRRPDLQVAELRARAQSARIGSRQVDLYPQFFLFGSIGLSDTVPSGDSLSASNAVTAAIGPGFSWNVFQYDRIKNQVRIEDALFQESLSNYNQQVLEAVREVSNALVADEYLQQQSRLNFAAVEASIRAFNISATQYDNGLVSYQRLLSTVEKMTLREDIYAQTRGSIANNVVSLSITEVGDGSVLLKCHAGCTAAEVMEAVGLELQDLFPQGNRGYRQRALPEHSHRPPDQPRHDNGQRSRRDGDRGSRRKNSRENF